MATYIDNIVKFHTFSKSPVSKDTTLGGAVNPSGHTVTTTQVRAQNIPAFLNTFQGTKEQAITWLGTNYPTPAHNDIVFYGGEFKAGFSTPKCLKWNAKLETPAWEDFDITTAATLKNADDKDVIAVHQNCTTVFVDGSNNAATNSNRNSLFVKRADGSILDHFVAATDKIVAGMPSLGYNALVLWNGGAIDEGELEANYIGNTFAGIVHLNKQYSTGDDAKFKVTCFEYIGEKLDTALGNIDGKIQDIVDTTMEGVVASVGTTDAATNAGISVDSTTKTSPKINITTGTVGGDSDAKLVTGSTVKTYVDSATSKATVSAEGVITTGDEDKLVTATGAQNIAGKVVSDATLTTPDGSSDAIKDATDTSKLVTAEQVKTYVTNNAQVTVKVGETEQATTNLELVGSAGDDVTITATADTADGYKVTFDATIDKAIVTDGVIEATTGNGDKVISATAAKAVAEKAIETALADTAEGSLGKKINDVQEIAEAKVADVTVDDSSIVGADKVAKLTTTGTDAIAADGESTSTKLATEASVAKTAQNLTTAIDAIAGVGVSYQVLADNEKHESVTAPVKGRIYLEKDETAADGTYIEWFYTGTDWEKIGSTKADHSGYAKTITINGEAKTVSNNAVDIGKAATSVTAGGGITSGTVSDTGALSLTLDEASTDKKGIAQLASTHEADDTTKAATGATVASAISGIASTSQSDNGVTVTTAAGSVTGVEVTTTSLVVEDALVESVTDDNLITAADALAAIKLAKPENYISTVSDGETDAEGNYVNITSGETALVIKDSREKVYADDLWGTTVKAENGVITVDHKWVTNPNIIGGAWNENVKAVQNNKAYSEITTDDEGNFTGVVEDSVIANIQTDMIKNGANMFVGSSQIATSDSSLNFFSGDLSSLINGYRMFTQTYLSSFNVDLSSLVNGEDMFSNCPKLSSFSGDLSSLVNGYRMFYNTSLASFSWDLSSLVNGSYMFYGCRSLTSFTSDLSSLVNGESMFNWCNNLTSFTSDLDSLVNGSYMFIGCGALTSFTSDLDSLVNGSYMFKSTSLASFSGDLDSLVNGSGMFSYTPLESFSGDLSSLVNGDFMFSYTSLASFSGDLSSLVNGNRMFYNTSLASFSGDLSSLVNGNRMFYYTHLESFSGDLSSLVDGDFMFAATSLDVESVELICDVLPNYNTENGGKTLQTATWNESGKNKGKYTYSDWTSGDYYYPIIKINTNGDYMSQGNTDGIDRSFGTESISASNVKSITIIWRDISVLSEDDRKYIAELFTNTATEKGWTFLVNTEIAESGEIAPPNVIMATDGTIQYYVFAKKDEATEDNATHIDASGKLWKFDTAEAIIGPNIKYWSMFATVEDALTEWGLTPWTKPQETEEA